MAKHEVKRVAPTSKFSKTPEGKFLTFLPEKKFLLILIFLSFIPFTWFRPWNTLITGGDFWLPLGTTDTLRQMFGSWLSNVSGGQPNNNLLFPWVVFFAVGKFLSLSISSTEKLWFVVMFLTGGLSVYYLTREVFNSAKDGWGNFLPPVLYLFNVYSMMTGVVTTGLVSYNLLPLLLLVYIKGLKSKNPLKMAIVFGLVSIFLTSAAANPPIYTIPFLVMLIYLIYRLLFGRAQPISWRFNLLAVFFYFLFNVWWIWLLLKTTADQLSLIRGITSAATPGIGSPLLDNVRLLGSWAFFASHMGTPYFPFAASYLNPILKFLTFLIPIFALLGLIFRKSKKFGTLTFFSALGFAGIFLSHGQADDFLGKVNTILMKSVPLFWIYREPYAKFTPLTVLSYSILLGSFFNFLELKIRSRILLNLAGLSAFIIILTVAWPLAAGQHFPDARGVLAPLRTNIPSYWFDLANFFRGKQNEGRVLISPDNPNYLRSGIPYAWGYDSADVAPFLLPVSWVERNSGYYGLPVLSDNLSVLAYRVLHDDYLFPKNISRVLSLLNVNRIVQRNDIDLRRLVPPIERYTPDYLKEAYSHQNDLVFERTFGSLDVYRVRDDKFLDKIYVPSTIVCVRGDTDRLDFPLSMETSDLKTAVLSGVSEFCQRDYINTVELNPHRGRHVFVSSDYRAGFEGVAEVFEFKGGFEDIFVGSDSRKYFGFEIDEEGIYEGILITDKYIQKSNFLPTFELFSSEGRVLQGGGSPSDYDRDLYGLGRLYLAKGKYLISLAQPSFYSVAKPDFGKWQSSLTDSQVEFSEASGDGKPYVILGKGQTNAYLPLNIADLDIAYEVSFQYQAAGNTLPSFFYWENVCDSNKPVWVKYDFGSDNSCRSSFTEIQRLEASTDWHRFSAGFRPTRQAKSRGIGLVFLKGNGLVEVNDGKTKITDVVVRPKFYGGVVLRKIKESPSTVLSDLTVAERGRTEYKVVIRGSSAPQVLVFSETFSPDWKADVKTPRGRYAIPEEKHLIVNGFANAWILDEKGDFEVKISYSLEKWFRLTFAVSVVGVAGSLAFLIWSWARKATERLNGLNKEV